MNPVIQYFTSNGAPEPRVEHYTLVTGSGRWDRDDLVFDRDGRTLRVDESDAYENPVVTMVILIEEGFVQGDPISPPVFKKPEPPKADAVALSQTVGTPIDEMPGCFRIAAIPPSTIIPKIALGERTTAPNGAIVQLTEVAHPSPFVPTKIRVWKTV